MSDQSPLLQIEDLHVEVGEKEILKGLDLTINRGEVHALMGPNGSGKSTLSNALMGHPRYTVTCGRILLDGKDILEMSADERARAGMFLAFQYPTAIPGVSVLNFLRASLKAMRGGEVPAREFRQAVREQMKTLKIDDSFMTRYVNDGFSGGEKKRFEALQMALIKPVIAILDETDSGLDIDALRIVAEGVDRMAGPERGILIITHYQRILNYIRPDFVHVLVNGQIVRSGGEELAHTLEEQGYDWITRDAPEEQEVLVNG
ncbi:MAG: Fe-S cluster assembly ATPase SufC [Armatimonadetes bacterium]|nr:Fe-S cluster assembly ATPase SufC [Armatimonadota bacterium]